jgi:hypothetical protein
MILKSGNRFSDKIHTQKISNARTNYFQKRDLLLCRCCMSRMRHGTERIFFNAVSAKVRFEMVRT